MLEKWKNYWVNHSDQLVEIGINIVISAVILLVCHIAARMFKRIIVRRVEKLGKFDATLIPVFSSLVKYLIYFVGIAIILDLFGVNSASIVTLLGTVGLAIGFALKDTLSNIASGIMLIILRPFNVGEAIQAAGHTGKIVEINLFTTIMKTPDGLCVTIPNSNLWGGSIVNFNRNGPRRLEVVVGIGYGDSLDKGLEVLKKVIASDERILAEPAPTAMVVSLGDSAVNLSLRAWTDSTVHWDTLCDLTKKVKEEIDAAGLNIPFPQRDVHIISKDH